MTAEHILFESDLETRYTTRPTRQLSKQTVKTDQVSHETSLPDYEMILEVQLDDNAVVRDILIKQALAPAHIIEPGQ